MVDFRFGPVELYLVSLDGDRPAPAVIAALTDLVAAGTVNLLDFVVVSKAEDGTVTAIEIEEHADEYGAADLEFAALGVTGQEDIDEFAELIEPGTSAAVVALELAWAARLSSAVQASSAFPPRSSTRSSTPSTTKESDMIRRVGRPGLIGLAARTAVVAGTASAVSGGVAARQQRRAQAQHEQEQYQAAQQQAQINAAAQQAVAAQQAYAAPPAPSAPAAAPAGGWTSSRNCRNWPR
ncbi:DUF6325 family protein [Microbacterium aurum]